MLIKDESVQLFLENSLNKLDFKVFQLAGDASTRKYYRVAVDNQSLVLMKWDPFQPEKYPFISVLNHFAEGGVHVPKIIDMSASDGLVLLEDLGDLTLERKFWEQRESETSFEYYKLAIDEIIKIHYSASALKKPCTAFDIEFNTEKFVWELNYGKDNLIKGVLGYDLAPKVESEIVRLFKKISETLHKEPKYISHRDYHSRNLMIKFDKMYVIDFQDARMGPVQYDLVSLIKDSYVDISDEYGQKILNYYFERAMEYRKTFDLAHFNYIYELQSIQRCFKACGSFASFFHQRDDRRYLKYLTPTLKRVVKSLAAFPEFKTFATVLVDSGALEKNYESL